MKNTSRTKQVILGIGLLLITSLSFAQLPGFEPEPGDTQPPVSLGINTISPKGVLDVNSNNMGIVIPIVSDLDAVTTPDGSPAVEGTIVFDNASKRLCLRIGDRWGCFGDDGNGGSTLSNFYKPSTVFQNQQAFLKASNIGNSDGFGYTVAISADGNTLAVGAPFERSGNASDPSDNGSFGAGAVYVFSRSGTTWTQQAYLKASNIDLNDSFGISVSLSGDGITLVVGSPGESSNSDTDQTNNSANRSGAVYVFTFDGTDWTQEAYLKASNIGSFDSFGGAVTISDDGNTLAVGADEEDSNSDTDQTNNDAFDSGAVYVFSRSGTTWTQEAYLKASNFGSNDRFGGAVTISDDGNTLAVGADEEDSNSATDQTNNDAFDSGAVYVFTFDGTDWTQEAYLKAPNIDGGDNFGTSVSLSANGNTLAIGARRANSNRGAAYIFTRSVTIWTDQAILTPNVSGNNDRFGNFISLSDDGNTLAVGANDEDSNNSTDPSDNDASRSGAVYIFKRSGTTWSEGEYLKASVIGRNDEFGSSVSLNSDGTVFAIGATGEDSNSATDQTNNDAFDSGAAYILTDN